MRRAIGFALLVLIAAAIGAPADGANQRVLTGTINQTTTWRCSSPVALDSVTVTIGPSSPSTDAVLLKQGCTGTIGSITIVQYHGDGLKIGAAANLTVNALSIRCYAHVPGKHQDGVQILGGSHIRVYNNDVGCYSANNSQMWWNPAGKGNSTGAKDVVFVGGKFQGLFNGGQYGPGGSYGVAILTADHSGVQNATICPNAHPARQFIDKGTNSVSAGNTIAASC